MSASKAGAIGNRNTAKTAKTTSKAPWESWTGSKAGLVMQFIESQCIVPRGHGAGSPLKLLPFQRQLIEDIYAEGVRSAGLQVSRGQGKTTLVGALICAELHLNEWSPDIPVVAPTISIAARSSGAFGIACRMTELNADMADRSIIYTANNSPRLIVPSHDGVCAPVSSRDFGGLQGLNGSLLLADEASELPVEVWNALTLSGGKRPESLALAISTPSGDFSSAMYALWHAVHTGVPLPGFHWTEYAADEGCALDDREQWRKANPALGVYLSEDAIAADVATTPEHLFRRYRLNQWSMGTNESWLGESAPVLWDAGNVSSGLIEGAPTWGGLDVSLRHDNTAVVLVQERPNGKWYAEARIWTAPPGGTIDQADVRHFIRQASLRYDLQSVAYDPRFAIASMQDLAAEGINTIEVPQSPQRMVPAIANLRDVIVKGDLLHPADEQFKSHVIGAQARDSDGGITLKKRVESQKIDACIALVLALLMANQPVQPLWWNFGTSTSASTP